MKPPPFFKASFTSNVITIVLFSFFTTVVFCQSPKETVQDLSKPSRKGVLNSVGRDESSGNIVVTYVMKVDKKSDQLVYEDYVFDKDLNFKGIQPGKQPKETKPDKQTTTLWAYAGGSNSFNVNSSKLSIAKIEGNFSWNYKRQRYELERKLSVDKIKLKNDESRYDGYGATNDDDGGVFVAASYNPEGKDAKDQFVALYVDKDLSVKETPATTGGNYSLVYFGYRSSGNPFMILAPKNKMPDLKQYVYAEFTIKAELVKRTTFTSPSPNMVVMDYQEIDGNLYLVGASQKGDDSYEDEFTDYADIQNPAVGSSRQSQKYDEDVYKKDFDNFHFIKMKDGELVFASSTPVKDFEKKVITPPGQKKAHSYEGKRLYVENLAVTPNGEYLLGGQLMHKSAKLKGSGGNMYLDIDLKYQDIVGLYFGSKGELKAQYAVEKMNDDNKSEVFSGMMTFIVSSDGKTAYWQVFEVKGSKGYANYWDAVADKKTEVANYFPRIAMIDLSAGSLSEFTVLGEKGKYLVYKNNSILTDEVSRTSYFIGHDNDYEKLWIGRYQFK